MQDVEHTHSYTSKVTQPTCTTKGYTTYTCGCGYSYKDNYTTGSHNYSNGKCTKCGASDPNFQEAHVHNYEMVLIKTAQETREVHVYFPYICNCYIGWLTYEEMAAHQDSTGLDGTCNSCGSYYYNGRETFMNQYVNPGDPNMYTCPNCGGHDFTRNSVHCGGWANGSKPTPLTGTAEYSVLQCSCGEILTENDKPGDRLFPTDGGYTYIAFYPDAASREKYDIPDNAFYSINY